MSGRWLLSAAEFDLVWARLGFGEHPYPLDVPNFGDTVEERALAARRLPPPAEELARALAILARPRVWIDSLSLSPGEQVPDRAIVAASGQSAVLVVQSGSGQFRVEPVRASSLVSVVLDLLPQGSPARDSVTLPVAAMASAADGYLRDAGHWQNQDSRARHKITEILRQPKQAAGQLTANGLDRLGRPVRTATLSWFDAPRRHLLVRGPGTDGADWITVAGADHERLRGRLNEMLDSVGGS
ncbi:MULTISPECIES: ESX secretion-associated protein EspG [unclassified Crossiella]|uniref:ESX secretion-associated protein EspG n=1 Tax=unclassified Crossiella TaxID=2620835 RepID=UPI001FFEF097|nr:MULTISPECIES: ESX secretion-associated protein EspG [unclassified Crossiella]MCK2240516.1 ESX secretion-associated protein EspG [Crossiella sp. S99.2]MCK2253033.1 ESX secretion-associated protein EspG [Crossiella sp. S99.1]